MRIKELEADNDNIIMEGNKACENYEINIDYDSMGDKDRYDVVHAVIEKAMLRRIKRYELECIIYNKVNEEVKRIVIDTYNKQIL